MRRVLGVVLAVLVLWGSAARAGIPEDVLETPDSFGDQVIFYYDARADFTTFINIRNGNFSPVTVNVLFYGPTFDTPFTKAVTLTDGALTTIDVGGLRATGLPAQAGVAIATVVDELGQAIATNALTGNFTVANLLTGSAFGAHGAARSAHDGDGLLLPGGQAIGIETPLQAIRPRGVLLASYYNPDTLAPVSASGNQLIFINFRDTYGPTYGAATGSTTWNVRTTRSSGGVTANGVTVTDLASVAGSGVNGAAGGMVFLADNDTPGLNRLVYFTESLGTFGTGYLLPPLKFIPLPD